MSLECELEEETRKGATCDMCGRGANRRSGWRLYSFTGATWIKIHKQCLAWMSLKLSAFQDEPVKTPKPKLRLVRNIEVVE